MIDDTEEPETDTCAYCGAYVDPTDRVPPADDDYAWQGIAEEHYDSCEWVATRAHRINLDKIT